jgi:radical SAM protein with 4Fe4S-binding SPASM domain
MVWGADVPTSKPPARNCVSWTMPFIFVTGDVIPCCATNEGNKRQFQKETSMGNIFKQPFREIWYGEKYNALRRKLFSGGVPPQCAACPVFDVSCGGAEKK